jgi:hypothetical protein
MTEPQDNTHERFEPRLKSRLSLGLLLGVLVGGILGLLVGFLAFDGRGSAIVACGLGGVIAGLLYGALVGSFAGLESPDPGQEPSDTAHPLSEPAIDEEDEPDLSGGSRGSTSTQ